jgi:hypothetical protein
LLSLQIDIDALNPRSSLILYSRGAAVSEFRVLKTYHIHFFITFKLCGTFPLPLADISDLPLRDASRPTPSLFASRHQHCSGVVDIVAGANSRPVWEASFAPSCFCPPSLETNCLPIVQHPRDLPPTRCSLPIIRNIWALLALLLAGIHVPFGMLLLRHHASARLPSNPFIYRPVHHPRDTSALHSSRRQHRSGVVGLSLAGIPTPFAVLLCAIKLLPAFPRIRLFTDCSTSERHFCPPLYFPKKL